MSVNIGSVIVSNGRGKVTIVEPTIDNTVLIADNSCPVKVRFTSIASLLSSKNILISMPVPAGRLTLSDLFKQFSKFIFPGAKSSHIVAITISTYSTSGSSYDLRIYDPNTSNVLATIEGLTNKESTMNTFDISEKLPEEDTVVELHIKSNNKGVKYVYVDQLYITYNIV